MPKGITTSKDIFLTLKDAKEASRIGDHRKASGLFLTAALNSKKLFQNKRDYYFCTHLSYIERLKLESCRDLRLINKIISNLEEAKNNIDDDRLSDQLDPVIRYFHTLIFCLSTDYTPLIEQIKQVHKVTDNTPHYIDSLAHVICESLQIVHCINEYNLRTSNYEASSLDIKEVDREGLS
jgi:hypothetical protein